MADRPVKWIPKKIGTSVDYRSGQTPKAEELNSWFNLLIDQGDWNADRITDLLNTEEIRKDLSEEALSTILLHIEEARLVHEEIGGFYSGATQTLDDVAAIEALRQAVEATRVTAESQRQANTATAIADAELATANANLATADAVTATSESELATANAVTATTNAVTATTNADVAAAEASDAAANAIDTAQNLETTYAPRLTDVEDELNSQKEDYANYKKPFHFNHAAQEYLNIGRFWDSFKNGKIYTTEFYHSETSPSSSGVKKGDNEGLICKPSTNTVRGRNDYENVGLFMSIDVNAYVDESDDYHVIAIKGDGKFKNDGTMGDVYVMAMPGYQKRYSDDVVWGISYSDTMHAGFEVLDEAVKPDGIIRPYLLHAKYVAGRNLLENNNLASISGVPAEHTGMSHNGQITEFKKKGVQYSGKTSHDDYYAQLMFWIKYATTNSQSVMTGTYSYYLQYANRVAEIGVSRVVITNAQANNLLVGSTVSIGDYGEGTISADRQLAQNYNLVNRANITDIVDLRDGNSAVYVDSSVFNTSLATTITTYPWNTGSCDNVLGQDGSPYSTQSGKEPFTLNGIEMMVGGYEIVQNLIIHNNSTDNRTDVYANYDCRTYATSPIGGYDLVGQISTTSNVWKYGSKMVISDTHPSIILVTETEASSTTGTGDGIYTNSHAVEGYRVWLSLGDLSCGPVCGLRCLSATYPLTAALWTFLGRLSATGRSRRRSLG